MGVSQLRWLTPNYQHSSFYAMCVGDESWHKGMEMPPRFSPTHERG